MFLLWIATPVVKLASVTFADVCGRDRERKRGREGGEEREKEVSETGLLLSAIRYQEDSNIHQG